MTAAGAATDRVVVVQAAAQGTGVLLTPTLVLTAAHVLGEERHVKVIHPRNDEWVSCEVVWRGRPKESSRLDRPVTEGSVAGRGGAEVSPPDKPGPGRGVPLAGRDVGGHSTADLAVLRAHGQVAPARSSVYTRQLRWGALDASHPLKDCQVVGFPWIQRDRVTNGLELDQYKVTVLPLASLPRGALVCEFSQPPAAEPRQGPSPLAGLSGAPVFAGETLLGIVASIPRGRDHVRLEAVPVERLLQEGFPALGPEVQSELSGLLETITDFHSGDVLFEEQYRKALRVRYRQIEIIGLDDLDSEEAQWDLDSAYLHLAVEGPGARGFETQRIDQALSRAPRVVVLRGEAGAGKTTTVWWLASQAAAGALGLELFRFNGLVPFVIPMRSLRAQGRDFPTPAQLAEVAGLMVDAPPPGWARRVLESGRGLLLVDGMDEVPQHERDQARRWLTQLLDSFEQLRCMVTMRPLAVQRDWLGEERPALELRLAPMSDPLVHEFVHAWHRTAAAKAAAGSVEHAQISALERDLLQQLQVTPSLRDLARTPLLCAVICALHRKRRGLLPTSRSALYGASLTMLLGERDAQRRIEAPEGIEIDDKQHALLLQQIAVWLVRHAQTQLSHEQATRQLALAVQGMPQVAAQGPAGQILRHVLNRSGLLQQDDDAIQFIHRTFQDYLAAKQFRESDSLGELLRHASEQDWEDVVRLVIGHCGGAEAARVVTDLVAQGDAADGWKRWKLYMLAALCASEASYLAQEVRAMVALRVKALMPPRNVNETAEMAKLGPEVLPLLPGPEDLTEEQQIHVLNTMSKIGSVKALPLVARYAQQSSAVLRQAIVAAWPEYQAETYARDVLACMKLTDLNFVVTQSERLMPLSRLPGVRQLQVNPAYFPRAILDTISAFPELRELRFTRRPIEKGLQRLPAANKSVARLSVDSSRWNPEGLATWTGLRALAVHQRVPMPDLWDQLARLPQIRALQLPISSPVAALDCLPPLPSVRSLILPDLAEAGDLWELARVFPSLTWLTIHLKAISSTTIDLTPLRNHVGLRAEILSSGPPLGIVGKEAFDGRLKFRQISRSHHEHSVLT